MEQTKENKTADLRKYHREWRRKKALEPGYAEKRRLHRLANYERVREQEKKSRQKNLEKHRSDSRNRMKEYRKTEQYKQLRPEQEIRRKYGLTTEQWGQMFIAQGSACAICRTPDNGGRRWHTDHCHNTKKVRGILCQHCNLMLGHARDNPRTLELAVDYLHK